MTKGIRVLLIDDNREYRDRLVAGLQGAGLNADGLSPPAGLDVNGIVDLKPQALLVDYQLDEHSPGEEPATYVGSTLAAALRERFPAVPIILTTRRSLLMEPGAKALRGAVHDLSTVFDHQIVKEDISRSYRAFAADLRALVLGFAALARNTAGWAPISTCLGATDDEIEELRAAEPPVELLQNKEWRVAEVARWLRQVVLHYPGVLYPPLHASVALGLNATSFLRDDVQEFFSNTCYTGILGPPEGRWWSTRLLTAAKRLLDSQGMEAAAPTDFAKAWKASGRKTLRRAVCNTTGKPTADTVCYILSEPVTRHQSLPYRPDNRPPCMDTARVSFQAIRTTDDFDEALFPPDARAFLRQLDNTA